MVARHEDALPIGATTPELKETFLAKKVLFYIERSTNSNAVIYEANVTADGKLDEANPLKVYWIMYNNKVVNEEGLNMIERNTAYGSTVTKDPSAEGQYIVTLSALKTKKIKLFMKDGEAHAVTDINGSDEELIHISVVSTSSWTGPKVQHVDLKGRKADGTIVNERIVPK
mmetsp:Transcript_14622/g.27115  ORF Transcript_14622/g.27115 Transcript_14622/m.27115 type:complete len:171 (+) Transcript_14622:138-650(+)